MSLSALILASLVAAAPAPESVLEKAIEDFEFGEHAAASTKLRSILEPIRLESKENVIVARQYLGACYFLLGRRDKARTQFSMLLALDSAHRLDPAVFSPALVKLFEEVRAETGLALAEPAPPPDPDPPVTVAPAPPPPAPAPKPEPSKGVQATVAHEPHSPALSLIPFGVGQFANRQPIKGAAFAVLEVGLLATAAATFASFEGLKVETIDGTTGRVLDVRFLPEDVDKANRLQTIYLATFWSGIAVMAAGIVEALISYPGDDVAPAAASVQVMSTGQGAAQSGAFVFSF